MSAPSKAGSPIQIGGVSQLQSTACGVSNYVALSPPSYIVPSDGVITEWSHRDRTAAPGLGRLQVWRPAGGTLYTLVGRSEVKAFAAGVLNTYPIDLPVSAGDVLGFRVSSSGTGCVFTIIPQGDAVASEGGAMVPTDAAPGETRDMSALAPGVRLDVSAILDPSDGSPSADGLPSNEFTFGKVQKNKKKGTAKLAVNVPGPGELELAKNKKVKSKEKTAEDVGEEKLPIKPKGKAKKKLNQNGKTKAKAEVTYTPDGGEPNTKTKKVKLKKP